MFRESIGAADDCSIAITEFGLNIVSKGKNEELIQFQNLKKVYFDDLYPFLTLGLISKDDSLITIILSKKDYSKFNTIKLNLLNQVSGKFGNTIVEILGPNTYLKIYTLPIIGVAVIIKLLYSYFKD
ncbi:hypothetical protein [Leptospira kmetyi]|uniref:hypothetical protein n=1 Tax=Leptospira kmetyi TaxID=408139 RepID=UPI0010825239|nr:hypothetical protein [Leptospira kmetyi]TGL71053.1 hypothetical protein EHQ67_04080 [Leptospira kmetyi]